MNRPVTIELPEATLHGDLALPEHAAGLVVFVHGSGSSRFSPRNRLVARRLNVSGLGTLLMDLLTPEEERIDERTRHLRFDIPLLARRVGQTVAWIRQHGDWSEIPLGLFGSSTGAAAALVAAAELPEGEVAAVVSRGGRPDLAGSSLVKVVCPTLLIVGGFDEVVLALNEEARSKMRGEVELSIIPAATHLFEEAGALEKVADLSSAWFVEKFSAAVHR